MRKVIEIIKQIFKTRIVKIVVGLFLFFLIVGIILAVSFNARCSSVQPNFKTINDQIPEQIKIAENNIQNYSRTEETTYLSFPEWYLVFNPQEYGIYIGAHKPSEFPYFTSIHQFWSGYCDVYGITKKNYPFNGGDHLTEVVIGTSFTVEYGIKGAWENTVGRISEWTADGEQTEEDFFAAKVAQDYGNFIPTKPWYEFPFGQRFGQLWTQTPFFGQHFLRKIERKIFLSFEYGMKSVYALVIRVATHAVYGVADTEVYVSATHVPDSIFQNPQIRMVSDLGNDKYIIAVPHYQGFTDTVPGLAMKGLLFVDIAGNDEILVTAVAPQSWKFDLPDGSLLFTMNMMTDDSQKRIVLQVPVRSLGQILIQLKTEEVRIEHLYDY
ncbi:MAG: hypothetical protein V4473_01745 [Patescibacteria group bacterium]